MTSTARVRIAFSPMFGLVLRNPGDAVYGTIAVGALLAAESARRETYPRTVAGVVVTLLLYWLAHSYSELVGQRLRAGERLQLGRLLEMMVHELPILLGAVLPLATLAICWIGGSSLTAAVTAAVWTSAAIVVVIEVAAALRSRLRGAHFFYQAAAGAALGSLILLLRAVLH